MFFHPSSNRTKPGACGFAMQFDQCETIPVIDALAQVRRVTTQETRNAGTLPPGKGLENKGGVAGEAAAHRTTRRHRNRETHRAPSFVGKVPAQGLQLCLGTMMFCRSNAASTRGIVSRASTV